MNQDRKTLSNYQAYPYPNGVYDGSILHRFLLLRKGDIDGLDVLDAGCGTGELSLAMALEGANVTAIDFSRPSIKIAERNRKNLGLKNITFECMDARNLSKINKKFDLVCCFGVLMYFEEQQKVFNDLVARTKEGGYINIALYNKFGATSKIIKKKILDICVGAEDREKRIKMALKLFSKGREVNKQLITKMMDTYCNKERLVTIGEVRSWFREKNLEVITSNPPIELKNSFEDRYISRRPYLNMFRWMSHIKNEKLNNFLVQAAWMPTQREVFSVLGRKVAK